MKLLEVAKVVDGKLRGIDAKIVHFRTDSRECKNGDLFFALKGKNFDGHEFVSDVYKCGAYAVVSREIYGNHHIVVKDVKSSLLELSRWKVRNAFKIAVTGSSGKTTTKEILAFLLAKHGTVCKTIGNMNTYVGVSLSILNGIDDPDFCVIEIGAQFPGDIAETAMIFEPDLSIITSIGSSHSAFIDVMKEKASISKWTKEVVIYDGNEGIKLLIGRKGKVFTRHIDWVKHVGLETQIAIEDKELNLKGIWGKGQIKDLEMALSVMDEMNLSWSIDDLRGFLLPKGRMNFENINGYTIVNDTYNASPESLYNTVEVASKIGQTVWVLAPMEEISMDDLKNKLMDIFNKFPPKAVFTIKNGFYPFGYPYTLKRFLDIIEPGDIIIVKGSRVYEMERILQEIRRTLSV